MEKDFGSNPNVRSKIEHGFDSHYWLIKMKTSYYAKSGNNINAVSIAGKCPPWFSGRQYKKLAPKYWFFQKYKNDGDKDFYIEQYQKEVLDILNPIEVYHELGENAILLCWEGKDKFCHRHIVSKWFQDKLNVIVEEI